MGFIDEWAAQKPHKGKKTGGIKTGKPHKGKRTGGISYVPYGQPSRVAKVGQRVKAEGQKYVTPFGRTIALSKPTIKQQKQVARIKARRAKASHKQLKKIWRALI